MDRRRVRYAKQGSTAMRQQRRLRRRACMFRLHPLQSWPRALFLRPGHLPPGRPLFHFCAHRGSCFAAAWSSFVFVCCFLSMFLSVTDATCTIFSLSTIQTSTTVMATSSSSASWAPTTRSPFVSLLCASWFVFCGSLVIVCLCVLLPFYVFFCD